MSAKVVLYEEIHLTKESVAGLVERLYQVVRIVRVCCSVIDEYVHTGAEEFEPKKCAYSLQNHSRTLDDVRDRPFVQYGVEA